VKAITFDRDQRHFCEMTGVIREVTNVTRQLVPMRGAGRWRLARSQKNEVDVWNLVMRRGSVADSAC
jgi:hypothetical protein